MTIRELTVEHTRNPAKTRRTRRKFSAAMKQQIISRARDLREHGLTWDDVSKRVGVNANLLCRWNAAEKIGTLGSNEYQRNRDDLTVDRLWSLRLQTNAIMRTVRECSDCTFA
jgi:transposase-like protein